jgi:hypothetical protein
MPSQTAMTTFDFKADMADECNLLKMKYLGKAH